jgi:hypothetical protein
MITLRSPVVALAGALLLALASTACGGSASSESSAPAGEADSSSWPQSVEETSPWPHFGFPNGMVTAPHWQAPRELGCVQRIEVRKEPQRDFQGGEGPRTEYGKVLGSTCRAAGAALQVTDDAGYEPLVLGDCKAGLTLSTSSATLAELRFATPKACEDYVKLRASVPPNGGNHLLVTTTLRVLAIKPAAAFEVVTATLASDTATVAVVDGP